MLWLTWRQFRVGAIAAGAALLALVATLAITKHGVLSLYAQSGLPGCRNGCAADATTFIRSLQHSYAEKIFYAGVFTLYLVPALIGMFWGAPLIAREFEHGTFRLAWNQSVTRGRWAAAKLLLVGCAAMLTAGVISLMLGWWTGPLYEAAAHVGANPLGINKIAPPLFEVTGVAPLGYTAFAFALGTAIGLLTRRTLPAMAITLVAFAAVQVLVPILVRPHLIPPVQTTRPLTSVQFNATGVGAGNQLILQVAGATGLPGNWVTGTRTVNAAGQSVTTVPRACSSLNNEFLSCLARHGVRMAITYQPASRYWALQSLETAMYLVLAGALGGYCYWRVRRPANA
jgi:hypothetical protein